MKLKFFILSIVFVLSSYANDYYKSAYGKEGEELKQALHEIIKEHKVIPYTRKKKSDKYNVWDALELTDEDPNNPNNVILIYTQRSTPKSLKGRGANSKNGNAWNREHIWPKSHGFPNKKQKAYTDIHHLRPADKTVNSSRGQKDFDWSDKPHQEAQGVKHDSDSWEPSDEVKGDIARMIFYVAVRYEGGENIEDLIISKEDTPRNVPSIGKLCTLLEWHDMDKVSPFEINRNDVIFDIQGNRNPFIDNPQFVKSIWGDQCE